jgi:catechol 2,3-dioxygenase-like lactoylglutathione lyase family enzyme
MHTHPEKRDHGLALPLGVKTDKRPRRPQYVAHYYAAFVLDPDGNKIEAVTYSSK